jgi:predicted Zn-dependent protease
VLCLSSPLKLEDIHLKLIGTAHYKYVAMFAWANDIYRKMLTVLQLDRCKSNSHGDIHAQGR